MEPEIDPEMEPEIDLISQFLTEILVTFRGYIVSDGKESPFPVVLVVVIPSPFSSNLNPSI